MNPSESPPETGGIGQKAREAAQSAADAMKSHAAEARERIKETATEMIDERRDQAADRIAGVGSALEESARAVESEDPNIAWLTNQAATRLQQAADYVRDCSWQRLRDDTTAFAQRHPLAFFGGMFAAGMAVGALVKAGMQGLEEAPQASADDAAGDELPPESDVTVSPGTEETYVHPAAMI